MIDNETIVKAIQQDGGGGDADAVLLYQRNRGLIRRICKRYAAYADLEDLQQEAFIALLKAAQSYRQDAGVTFTTYAGKIIQRHCARYAHTDGRLIAVPGDMMRLTMAYKALTADGRQRSRQEIMQQLDITAKQYDALMQSISAGAVVSLDAPVSDDEETVLSDTIPDKAAEPLEDTAINADCRRLLWERVEALPESERRTITDRYKDGLTQDAAAVRQGTAKHRVADAERKALSRLRRDQDVQTAAQQFGYDCRQSYHYGLQRWRDTGISSVEWVALKHLDE